MNSFLFGLVNGDLWLFGFERPALLIVIKLLAQLLFLSWQLRVATMIQSLQLPVRVIKRAVHVVVHWASSRLFSTL